jgi:catechol 2,3-dioxygenase-like lactoylglutathione lyase family enzyme
MTAPLELAISTQDIEGMIRFYTEIIGLRLVADNPVQPEISRATGATLHGYRIVRLQTPYGERIKLVQSGVPPKRSEPVPHVLDRHGMAFLTFVIAGLDEMILRLRDQGVKLLSGGEKVEVRPGVFAIFSLDPEGNVVELVEYPDVASYRPDLYRWRQFF